MNVYLQVALSLKRHPPTTQTSPGSPIVLLASLDRAEEPQILTETLRLAEIKWALVGASTASMIAVLTSFSLRENLTLDCEMPVTGRVEAYRVVIHGGYLFGLVKPQTMLSTANGDYPMETASYSKDLVLLHGYSRFTGWPQNATQMSLNMNRITGDFHLDYWRQMNPSEKTYMPSWSFLVQAGDSTSGGNGHCNPASDAS